MDDAIFDEVIEQLNVLGCDLIKIQSREAAEKFILESNVIVCTMSSTLWWASELPMQKIVISLDLWNITMGDKCSNMDNIIYANSMAELMAMDFPKHHVDHSRRATFPTLTAHIKQKYAEKLTKHVS